MMMMYKISHSKIENLADDIKRGLHHFGRAMQWVDDIMHDDAYGERSDYGERSGYGMRHGYGMRDDMDYRYPIMDEEEMGMRGGYGEHRGRNSMGRFTRM